MAPPAGGAKGDADSRSALRRADGTISVLSATRGRHEARRPRRISSNHFYTTKSDSKGSASVFLAYGILERHHATVDVESAPGKGTVFHADVSGQSNRGPAAEVTVIFGRRNHEWNKSEMAYLVVDDELIVANRSANGSGRTAYRVEAAGELRRRPAETAGGTMEHHARGYQDARDGPASSSCRGPADKQGGLLSS